MRYDPQKWNPILAEFMGWRLCKTVYGYNDYVSGGSGHGDPFCIQIHAAHWVPHEKLNHAFVVVDEVEERTSVRFDGGMLWSPDGMYQYFFGDGSIYAKSEPMKSRREAIYGAICAAVDKIRRSPGNQ